MFANSAEVGPDFSAGCHATCDVIGAALALASEPDARAKRVAAAKRNIGRLGGMILKGSAGVNRRAQYSGLGYLIMCGHCHDLWDDNEFNGLMNQIEEALPLTPMTMPPEIEKEPAGQETLW